MKEPSGQYTSHAKTGKLLTFLFLVTSKSHDNHGSFHFKVQFVINSKHLL